MEIWLADQQSQTQLNIIGVTREDLRSGLIILSIVIIIIIIIIISGHICAWQGTAWAR